MVCRQATAGHVSLAKSNVLRYFESREAILLDLLGAAFRRWSVELPPALAAGVDRSGPARVRGDQLAAAPSRSLVGHEVLCDLTAARPGVLEHNLSAAVVPRFKRAAAEEVGGLAAEILRHVPELGERAWSVCVTTLVLAGALVAHARPTPSALAAYEADPALAAPHLATNCFFLLHDATAYCGP